MLKEGKIGVYETICLMILAITSKMYFASPSQLTNIVGNAAWIETIISGTATIIAFAFIYLLMKRFPNKDLVTIFQEIFGIIIGKLILVGFVIYFIFYVGMLLREFTEILKTLVLSATPISVIFISFLICMIILCFLGLESITRTAAFFFIWILIAYAAILILPLQNFRFYRFWPLFGYGLDKIFITGIQRSSAWSEIIVLPFILGSLQGIKNFKKIGFLSIIVSTILITFGALSYILTFRYYIASEPISGLFQLAQAINYGRFFQRLESLFLFAWVLSTLICLSLGLYFIVITFAKTFKLSDYKPLLVPFSILTFIIAILPANFTWVSYTGILAIRTYSWIPAYGIPILALIVSIIRGKKRRDKECVRY